MPRYYGRGLEPYCDICEAEYEIMLAHGGRCGHPHRRHRRRGCGHGYGRGRAYTETYLETDKDLLIEQKALLESRLAEINEQLADQ